MNSSDVLPVTSCEDLAVNRDHGESKQIRVDFREFRDVVGDLSLVGIFKLQIELIERILPIFHLSEKRPS